MSTIPPRSPWSAELRAWSRIAVAASLTFLMGNAMNVVDISILGHLDEDPRFPGANSTAFLTGAALANTWMCVMDVGLYAGFAQAVNILSSQAYGAKNFALADTWLRVGVVAVLMASVLVGGAWAVSGNVAQLLLGPASCDVMCGSLTNTYSRLSILWLPAFAIYQVLNNYLLGQNIVMPGLVANAIFLLVNFSANWLLVYGPFEQTLGFGFVASPLATAFSRWGLLCTLLLYVACFMRRPEDTRPPHERGCCPRSGGHRGSGGGGSGGHRGGSGIGNRGGGTNGKTEQRVSEWEDGEKEPGVLVRDGDRGKAGAASAAARVRVSSQRRMWSFCSFAIPLAVGGFVEELQIQVVSFFAGALGPAEVAANNGLLQIFFMLTAVNYGLMRATTVRVGNHLGNGDAVNARRVVRIALLASSVYGLAVAMTFIFAREYLGRIVSSDPHIWHLIGSISWQFGAGYFLLSIFFVSMATLEGQGRTTAIAVSFFIGAWCISVPLAAVFGLASWGPKLGLPGLWYGVITGYAFITLMTAYAVWRSRWGELAKEAHERSRVKDGAEEEAGETAGEAAAVGGGGSGSGSGGVGGVGSNGSGGGREANGTHASNGAAQVPASTRVRVLREGLLQEGGLREGLLLHQGP